MTEANLVVDELITRLNTTGYPVYHGHLSTLFLDTQPFPLVTIIEHDDEPENRVVDVKVAKVNTEYLITAAVKRSDYPDDINEPSRILNTILKDIRKSLVFNWMVGTNSSLITNLSFLSCKRGLGGDSQQYSVFEFKIAVSYMEKRT